MGRQLLIAIDLSVGRRVARARPPRSRAIKRTGNAATTTRREGDCHDSRPQQQSTWPGRAAVAHTRRATGARPSDALPRPGALLRDCGGALGRTLVGRLGARHLLLGRRARRAGHFADLVRGGACGLPRRLRRQALLLGFLTRRVNSGACRRAGLRQPSRPASAARRCSRSPVLPISLSSVSLGGRAPPSAAPTASPTAPSTRGCSLSAWNALSLARRP